MLVVGLGPAGFNLAHHLMNDGHAVVGIDGLKIEPLPVEQSGVSADGARHPFAAVRDIASLREDLGERAMAGFGGVAEYGITVRWDKNYLKMVRLLLERRGQFSMFGGVRFGGTVTVESAFAMGFDHVALCAGAGKPTVLDLPNGLARGVRAASDFLMALQLTGAAKKDSIANLQIRLPVVVIGGGLTAIDTATELLAYYPLQVEKFLARHETLVAERGEAAVRAAMNAEEREIADEFIAHAEAIRAERAAAAREGRAPDIAGLVNGWGGVTIAYRRRLIDSPSYTLNHEEVLKALEEDIRFAEGLSPVAVEVDANGHASALKVAGEQNGEKVEATLPARTILVAAGTQPNTVLAREDATHAFIDGKYFRALDEEGNPATPERVAKPADVRVLMYRAADGRFMSFFGDLHPSFAGNVVKAMGGAKQGYPVLTRTMEKLPASKRSPAEILAEANAQWRAKVVRVDRLTPTIVEVVVEAPAAARNFEPGQFYRLQNYEARSKKVDGTLLTMEGLALTGAWVDKDKGLLSLITLEMGGSSDLCALLEPGEPVIVMGPTGTPTEIEPGETVVLAGGGLGNAVLFSIGQAFRKAGSKVLYFAGYKKPSDRYKVEEIEAAADVVVWGCDEEPGFPVDRPQDKSVVANIVEAMRRYASGELGRAADPLQGRRPHHRHRLGRHDERRAAGAACRAEALPQGRSSRAGVDQLPHAMHDEGDLRPVPAAPQGSGDRQGVGGVLLLQPGPGARPRRLRLPAPAPAPERRAGEDRRTMDRPFAKEDRRALTRPRLGESAMSDQPSKAPSPIVCYGLAIYLIGSFLWRVLIPAHEYPGSTATYLGIAVDVLAIVGLVGSELEFRRRCSGSPSSPASGCSPSA